MQISQEIKEECTIPNIVFVDDGYEKTLTDNARKVFSTHLPLEKRIVLPESQLNGEFAYNGGIKLYKCVENNGKYRVTELKSGPLVQADLNSDASFPLKTIKYEYCSTIVFRTFLLWTKS